MILFKVLKGCTPALAVWVDAEGGTQHLVAWQNYYDLLYLMHSQWKDKMLSPLVKFYAHTAWQILSSVLCPAIWLPHHAVCLPPHYSTVTSPILCSKLTFLTKMSSPPMICWAMGKDQPSLVYQTILGDIMHFSLVIMNWNFCENKMSTQSNAEEVTCSFRLEVRRP